MPLMIIKIAAAMLVGEWFIFHSLITLQWFVLSFDISKLDHGRRVNRAFEFQQSHECHWKTRCMDSILL